MPDSVKRNGMTQWFLQDKDLEALGYLMFAKKCEVYAAPASDWNAPAKDMKGMGNAVKAGLQLWKAAKKDFSNGAMLTRFCACLFTAAIIQELSTGIKN